MIPDNENIIDVTMEAFKDIPKTLNGEVLLKRTVDKNGKPNGYLTTTIDRVMSMKDKTDEELEQVGWLKFKHIIDSF